MELQMLDMAAAYESRLEGVVSWAQSRAKWNPS
jgi:hypothetical protein